MNREDAALALFREANPVPDADRFKEQIRLHEDDHDPRSRTMDPTIREAAAHTDDAQSRRHWMAGAVAGVLVLIAGLTGWAVLDGDDVADTPESVIERYTLAYNDKDIEAVMALFTDDSVVIGHPFDQRSEGLDAIRTIQQRDMNVAADEEPYVISNLQSDGDVVTWDHTWTNAHGVQYCRQGHSAEIRNGAILSWTWGTPSTCPS